jgi:hypothetical protein
MKTPLTCHRCWNRIAHPLEHPPYSHVLKVNGESLVLLLLCPACRDTFADDRARNAFLERAYFLSPFDFGLATDAGLRVVEWDPRRPGAELLAA